MPTQTTEYSLPDIGSLSLSGPSFFDIWVKCNGFKHDPTAFPTKEFDRLAEHMRWEIESEGYHRWQQKFAAWLREHSPPPSIRKTPTAPSSNTKLQYFDEFRRNGFVPDPTVPLRLNFMALARAEGWDKDSKKFSKQQSRCYAEEFEVHYGNKTQRLEGWQRLCSEVQIDPVPETITKCKKASIGVWVNIVDLIDCRATGEAVFLHPSRNALRRYSTQENKIFNLRRAKSNGFLTALLIEMY